MKRIKLVFFAALGIVGYVGAAASSGVNKVGTMYHKISANNYEEMDPADQGTGPGTWNCLLNPTETCVYQRSNPSQPISDSNATRAESGVFVQN